MATWPSQLQISKNSYNEAPPNRVLTSSMEVGMAKKRRRSSMYIRPLSLKLFLTPDLLQVLDEFYLDNDVLVFDFTHPRTNLAVRARFTEPPSYSLNETMYDVSVNLEILP